MPAKSLTLDSLDLDLENPRIKQAADQREAMQNIISEQKAKLINLAESVSERGFSPIDRCLVMRSPHRAGHFIVLEGNRRVLAAKLLRSPALVADLEMPESHKRRLVKAGQKLDPKKIERVDCFEIKDRPDGVEWIRQRHSGEDNGRGIVGWNAIAVARFKGRDAALQAMDFVGAHADLTEEQAELLAGKFPISTLDRLLSTPDVRRSIGFEVVNGKLQTELPPEEALKPLRRMTIDLAEKRVTVSDLKSKEQQLEYVRNLKPADKPNLTKRTGVLSAIEGIKETDFKPKLGSPGGKTKGPRPSARTNVVPKSCKLNITNAKIEKINGELKILQLSKHVHAISVLLRVFLEMSVDEYLVSRASSTLKSTRNGHISDKKLAAKVQEVVDHMVANGADRKDFKGVLAALTDEHHPFSIDTLHAYIHNRFFTPTERSLTTAWDNAQRFFEMIWP
ncbi:MAG TPA: hypothetical protein VK335_29520 [Bryobacteraceae bacterium]|nr:hypothetical protein [Bryobacteraceae bacterium]